MSTALLIVVLTYIYPMRIMLTGMISWFTAGFSYALLGAWIPLAISFRARSQPGGHAP